MVRDNRIIRNRDKFLPAFNAGMALQADYGYFDHISIVIPAYTLTFQNIEECRQFRQHFFTHGIIYGDGQRTRYKSEPQIRPNDWLFNGKVFFSIENHINDTGGFTCEVKYSLSLNPSRFLHHAYLKLGSTADGFSLETLRAMNARRLLEAVQEINTASLSLDLKTNYIPECLFRLVSDFEGFQRFYIDSVVEFIDTCIEDSYAATTGNTAVNENYLKSHAGWVINDCEAYYEMAVVNSINFVHELWPSFRSIFFGAEIRYFTLPEEDENNYPDAQISQTQEMNAVALYTNIGVKGLRLIVYAKTYNRVRFEIRYNSSIRSLFDRTPHAGIPNSYEGLFTALGAYKSQAQERLQQVLDAIPDFIYSERADYQTFVKFLSKLASAQQKHRPETSLDQILSSLIMNESIVVVADSNDHRLMKSLKAAMIVQSPRAVSQSPRGRKRYILNQRYVDVVRAFGDVFSER